MPLDKGFEFRFGEHEFRTVRESVAAPVRFIPIDKTLATTNTAEDLVTTSPSVPAFNLVTNSHMVSGGNPPTGWTAVGATVTRVTTTPRVGTHSMQVATGNAAAAEGAYFEAAGIPPGNYALSVYLRHSGGGTARVRASSDGGTTFTNGNTVTMANNWNGRSTVIHKVSPSQSSIRLYVVTNTQQNITYLVDSAQIEPSWQVVMGSGTSTRDPNPPGASATPVVDPLSDRFSRWLGTTDASNSVREPGLNEIHHLYIYSSHATYVDFDRTVAIRTAVPLGFYMAAGIDYKLDIHKIIKNNISFVNASGSETPKIIGYAMGF